MTIPRRNSSANRSMIAVWLCRKFCHHRPGTNCGTTMVMMGQRNWLAIAIYSAIVGLIPVYVLVHMMGIPATTLFIG